MHTEMVVSYIERHHILPNAPHLMYLIHNARSYQSCLYQNNVHPSRFCMMKDRHVVCEGVTFSYLPATLSDHVSSLADPGLGMYNTS